MGIYKKGILGAFSGKVGNIVGSSWKGRQIFRTKPVRRNGRKISPLQLGQRARFALLTNFLLPLKMLFDLTFAKTAHNMSCFNKAVSENKDAINGLYPKFFIDYQKIILSRGNLENVSSPKVVSIISGQIIFAWKDNSGVANALSSDFNFVAAYCAEINKWIVGNKAATRKDESFALNLSIFSGREAHIYMMSYTDPGNLVSNSMYLGMVEIL
jgi:hypothetical protein